MTPDSANGAGPGDRPLPQPYGLTLLQFCARYRYSRSGYAKMKKRGEGPVELELAGKMVIEPAEELAWLERQRERSRKRDENRFGFGVPDTRRGPAKSSSGKRLGRPPADGWPDDPLPAPIRKKLGRPRKASQETAVPIGSSA